jgi:hypothetical protein
MKRRPFFFFVLALAAFFTLASSAFADPPAPDKDGYINTGSGIRTKTVAIITANVYAIRHDMKGPLPGKSKRAVIDADVDKRFSWRMMRDVEHEKIIKALREAFAMNGYNDGGRIDRFVGAFTKELKEGSGISISYNSANKTTSIWVQGQGAASVDGVDFMKAVWSIWFGKIDQPSLGDQLISRIP